MTMARRWRLLILLAALAAAILVVSAARFESEHKSKELKSKDSLSRINREREWWEEEEEEEEERRRRERERHRERKWEEEEEEEEEWERREEEEREEEREREREEEREKQREREREREREQEREREREERKKEREERERKRQREEEEEREERKREREREEEEREAREREKEEKEEKEEKKEREREKEEKKEEKEREREEEEKRRPGRRNETEGTRFILEKPKALLSTEAGSVKVLPRRLEDRLAPIRQLGLGFVTLEPKALLLPHYLDAPVVIYVKKGNARLGWVENHRYLSTDLSDGDIYALPGGIVHYILNTDSKLRLEIFSVLDARESLNPGHFQPVFVAGGWDPVPVLSGFNPDVLSAAFKVDRETLSDILNVQKGGGIIYTVGPEANETDPRIRPMLSTPSWWNGWNGVQDLLEVPWNRQEKPFNLLTKKPDFRNDHGWSSTVDKKAFPRLKHADLGLFAVSLEAGSMLAPHWNARATEIGLVTKGNGYVHVAFPNGTKALDARVSEGTVFVVPRYYPVSQVASRDGTFEFVGYSTCSKPSKPQFLAGTNSVLNILSKEAEFDVLAAAFDVSEDTLRDFLASQKDAVILPGYVQDVNETEQRTNRAAY